MIESDRFVASTVNEPVEESIERALRPKELQEYVGQEKVRSQLEIFISAAKNRNEALDHVLLFGPPGLGKTTLAHIIAKEMGVNLRQTSGPVLEKAGDLAALLTNLEPNDVLFIDTNPVPVKTALYLMGKIENEFRAPLCELSRAHLEKIKEVLERHELLVGK